MVRRRLIEISGDVRVRAEPVIQPRGVAGPHNEILATPGAPATGSPATMPNVVDSGAQSYRLTEEQILLRDTIHALADEKIAPRAAEIDRSGEFPEDIRQLLAAHDVLALPFPEEHGGVGADLLTLCLAVEQIARACTTSSLILTVQGLGSLPILLGGSDEQKARLLPDLASGKKLAAFALTEPEAGSDAAAARTRAVRDGDAYVIDGGKRFITNGSVASLITVFAVTDSEAPRHQRLSCFAVEVPTPGFSVARLEHKLGIRGSPTAELSFDGVRVPVVNRIGEEGDGWKLAMGTFDRSRPAIAAQAVGIAQGALDVAVGYARDRKQFGQRIGDFQMVQAMLADMDSRVEAARQLTYKACVEVEAGGPDAARWASICKLVAGDAAMAVTTDAVQVLGGYGYTDDFPVERMMRDAKITQLYEGTQQIQRLVIARALLGKA
jgi:alkylation response protein AidB-like acyl-CoA dehydrogenase